MIANEFDNWQASPPPAIHTTCSPNLLILLSELVNRWPGFHNLGCFGRRAIRGGTAPSSHWHGAAIDAGYLAEMDELVADEVCPFLVARSSELHLQAIHDYRRARIWRAARTPLEADACDAWWKAQRTSRSTGMGQQWANHLHLEVTAAGWRDQAPIYARWTEQAVPTGVYSTQFIGGYCQSNATQLNLSYLVPAGKLAVVRSIDMFASTPGTVMCGRVEGGLVLPFLSSNGLGTFQTRHWDGDQVLLAGETLRCQWVDGVISVTASGFLLNLVPQVRGCVMASDAQVVVAQFGSDYVSPEDLFSADRLKLACWRLWGVYSRAGGTASFQEWMLADGE